MKKRFFSLPEILIGILVFSMVMVMTFQFWKTVTSMYLTERDVIEAIDKSRNALLQISLDIKQAAAIEVPADGEKDHLVLLKQVYDIAGDPSQSMSIDNVAMRKAPIKYSEIRIKYELEEYTEPYNPFGLKKLIRIEEDSTGNEIDRKEVCKDIADLSFYRGKYLETEPQTEPNDNHVPASAITSTIDIVKYNEIEKKYLSEDMSEDEMNEAHAKIRKYVLTQSLVTRIRGTRL